MIRCLYRPGQQPLPQGDGAPRGGGKSVVEARNRLAGYLDGALMRPLYSTDQEQFHRVEQALETMSVAERVYLEIEMQEREKVFHSYNYEAI